MEPYIGEIRLFAFNYAPQYWMPCQGQLMPVTESYGALFAVLGTTYGGDGEKTFALPNIPPLPQGAGYYIAILGIYPQRQ